MASWTAFPGWSARELLPAGVSRAFATAWGTLVTITRFSAAVTLSFADFVEATTTLVRDAQGVFMHPTSTIRQQSPAAVNPLAAQRSRRVSKAHQSRNWDSTVTHWDSTVTLALDGRLETAQIGCSSSPPPQRAVPCWRATPSVNAALAGHHVKQFSCFWGQLRHGLRSFFKSSLPRSWLPTSSTPHTPKSMKPFGFPFACMRQGQVTHLC